MMPPSRHRACSPENQNSRSQRRPHSSPTRRTSSRLYVRQCHIRLHIAPVSGGFQGPAENVPWAGREADGGIDMESEEPGRIVDSFGEIDGQGHGADIEHDLNRPRTFLAKGRLVLF